jgi:hypothetical protein
MKIISGGGEISNESRSESGVKLAKASEKAAPMAWRGASCMAAAAYQAASGGNEKQNGEKEKKMAAANK